jgi:hypothetical protein
MTAIADVRALAAERTTEIDKLMSTLYERGQFNGAILVASQGNIIYRKAFGKANFQMGADFFPETPSNMGSAGFHEWALGIHATEDEVAADQLDHDCADGDGGPRAYQVGQTLYQKRAGQLSWKKWK